MPFLNLAEWASGVNTLGPGSRTVIWVQGCLQRCPGCYSPEWQPVCPALLVDPMECARIITERTSDCGLTVSGGEPMLQAAGLLQMWHSVKKMRNDWTLLLFSGYYHSQLLKENHPDKVALVQAADAFVGGPYVAALNDGRGIRGSTNKEIWVPEGSRFSPEDVCFMAAGLRDVEYRERAYGTLAIGVPKPNAYQMDKGS